MDLITVNCYDITKKIINTVINNTTNVDQSSTKFFINKTNTSPEITPKRKITLGSWIIIILTFIMAIIALLQYFEQIDINIFK